MGIWCKVRNFAWHREVFKFENPTPVQSQTPTSIIDPTEIYPCFHLRNDHAVEMARAANSSVFGQFAEGFETVR